MGLIDAGGEPVRLDREEGALRLSLGEEGEPLRHLGSCTVSVEGPRLLRRLWVRDWSVITGYDGSAPFVGTLERDGGALLLTERGSGLRYLLDVAEAPELEGHLEELVLVTGFVAGPQRIHVMGWRPLGDP